MFIVLELQQTAADKVSVLTYPYADGSVAENKYHTILAAAATSSVPVHAAAMLNEMGALIKHEYYVHSQEVEE